MAAAGSGAFGASTRAWDQAGIDALLQTGGPYLIEGGRQVRGLLSYANERLAAIPGLRIIGRTGHRAPLLSVVVDGVHAHDMGTLLDRKGVAVRTGHHCAMPLTRLPVFRSGARVQLRPSLACEINRLPGTGRYRRRYRYRYRYRKG